MEQSKCGQQKPTPRPNLKNKAFVQWSKAESCWREDNIVSTSWHETLKTTNPFVPAYGNTPLCMTYLLNGEYGRIWMKERDDWFKNVFVPKGREREMAERRNKIRKAALAAKKKAQKETKEYKARKAKEAEAKAKLEAEKAEKIKARALKCAALEADRKMAEKKKNKKGKKAEESPQKTEETKNETCPKDWVPVELTVQCECSGHQKETESPEPKGQLVPESAKSQPEVSDKKAAEDCVVCGDLLQQIRNTQSPKADTSTEER